VPGNDEIESGQEERGMPEASYEPPEGLLWVVIERSDAGETTVGVFSTLRQARKVVDELGAGRLEAYRIEGHALDLPRREALPWQVVLTRDGEVASAIPFIGCSCADDEDEHYRRSYIEPAGDAMHVIAFAITPGQAIAVANEYRAWLQANGHWDGDQRRLTPIHARSRMDAA
jgi:hypothetical protein